MPTFEIQLDDGRKFHVDATDQQSALAGIQQHLGSAPQQGGVLDAARQGAADLLSGFGETGQRTIGMGQPLKDAGTKLAPAAKADTTLYDDKGFHAENIGNALAEQAPGLAAAMAAARLTPGPIWAKLAAAAGVGIGASLGNNAKEATKQRTGDENAPSNAEDLKQGLVRSAPEAALQALPLGRIIEAPVAKLGMRGVAGALGRTAADAAGGAAGSGAANVYDQAVTTGQVDPTQAINAGASGALGVGALSGGRLAGDVKAAVKYRGLSGEDPAHIAEAANRVNEANTNSGGSLRNTGDGYDAMRSAQADVENERTATIGTLAKGNLSADSSNALARARSGLLLSDKDAASLVQDTNNPNAVADLQRLAGVARALQGFENVGKINDKTGTFKGGISAKMEDHVRALANPVGAAASLGLAGMGGAHLGDVFAHSPEAITALAGAYGLARLSDFASGNRSPVKDIVSRFSDGNLIPPTSVGSGIGQVALAKMAGRPGPTGPSVPLNQPWSAPPPQPAPPVNRPGPTGPNMPLTQPWGAPPPAPAAPAPAPQWSPNDIAMRMLASKLKSPPQAPTAPPAPAPELPQFNPLALKMLRDKLANPPQAPAVSPSNLGAPPAPTPAVPLPEAPTKVTKTEKSGVKETAKPQAPAQEVQAPPTDDALDLTIPEFLRRSSATTTAPATQVEPQAQLATKAMTKLVAPPKYNSVPSDEHLPVEHQTMAPKDYADLIQSTAAFKSEPIRQGIERNQTTKQDMAAQLKKLLPKLDKKFEHGFLGEITGTTFRNDIKALREYLKAAAPDKAAKIDSIMSSEKLQRTWTKAGTHRGV